LEIQLLTTPSAVVPADVDNDGDVDLITLNTDGSLSILHNNSNGGFGSTAVSVPVASGATSLSAADIDEDGDLDLLTANLDNTVTILRNVNGGYLPANSSTVAVVDPANNNGPTDVKAADVDGDGDLDLITANFHNSVSVLRNSGGGSFTSDINEVLVSPTGGYSPILIGTADLNRDGVLDITTVNSNNNVTVLLNTPSAPLPVTLVSFTATAKGPEVVLAWKTAMEHQNQGFEVQVANNSRNGFRPLQFVPSRAPNSVLGQSYMFVDQQPEATGILYYRLRQVDLDGKETYSPVAAVQLARLTPRVLAYPNPCTQQVHIQIAGMPAAPARLALLNSLGQTVLTQSCGETEATQALLLTLPDALPAGSYLLQVKTLGQTFHQRLIRE